MPEVSSVARNRWYRIKWPNERQLRPAWAEKYFDSFHEAFDYAERRHRPVRSHESGHIGAVWWILHNVAPA